jgi:hypothetical protein
MPHQKLCQLESHVRRFAIRFGAHRRCYKYASLNASTSFEMNEIELEHTAAHVNQPQNCVNTPNNNAPHIMSLLNIL